MSNLFRQLSSIIGRDGALSKFEKATRVSNDPGLSISYTLLIRFRVLAEWLARRVLEGFGKRQRLAKLRSFRGSRNQIGALVLANGPSLGKLDPLALKNQVESEVLEVWCVNYFPLTETCTLLAGRYFLVLSDPATTPDSDDPATVRLWETIRKNRPSQIFVPTTWSPIPELREFAEVVTYFNDLSLEGWTKNIAPTRARAYLSLTAYKALALASYFDYQEVLVLGFDNSMYQTLRVDEKNNLIQNSNHADGANSKSTTELNGEYRNGISDYFYDISRGFRDLNKFFPKKKIRNLDAASNIDSFEKIEKHRLIKSMN